MDTAEQYAKIVEYIDTNSVATLGTVNEDGSPHGAVVYVCADPHHKKVYFLTKNQTQKFKNLIQHDTVSLTIVNEQENSTLQADGHAAVTNDAQTLDMVMKKMIRANSLAATWIPPVSKLEAGQYAVVEVILQHARLAEYKGTEHDDKIFTEI